MHGGLDCDADLTVDQLAHSDGLKRLRVRIYPDTFPMACGWALTVGLSPLT